MTEQPYWWHAEEAWRAANAPEARGRSRRDRPGTGEDVPSRAEAEADERDDHDD